MIRNKVKFIAAAALCTTMLGTQLATLHVHAATADGKANDVYAQRFLEMREKISDPANGYYREITKDGKTYKIPYHSRETFLCSISIVISVIKFLA